MAGHWEGGSSDATDVPIIITADLWPVRNGCTGKLYVHGWRRELPLGARTLSAADPLHPAAGSGVVFAVTGLPLEFEPFGFEGRQVGDEMHGTLLRGNLRQEVRLTRRGNPVARCYAPPAVPEGAYAEEEIVVRRGDVRLSGTLTLPKRAGVGGSPTVILLSGSSPHPRDYNGKFLVAARYLACNGIGSLRFDARGVGASGGVFADATLADLADDAVAAIGQVKGHAGVDAQRVGIIGHSQGAWVGLLAAARSTEIKFVVALSGATATGADLCLAQLRADYVRDGLAPGDVARRMRVQQGLVDTALKLGPENVERFMAALGKRVLVTDADRDASATLTRQIPHLCEPGMNSFLRFAPADALREVRVPLLWMNGEKDELLDAPSTVATVTRIAAESERTRWAIVQWPALGHGLDCPMAAPVYAEWKGIASFSPEVLDHICDWIGKSKGVIQGHPALSRP